MSIKEKYVSKIKVPFCVKSLGSNLEVNLPLTKLLKDILDEELTIQGVFEYYGASEHGYNCWDEIKQFGDNTHLYSFEELQDIVNSIDEEVVSKPSPSKISFPCAVEIEGFTEDKIIDLNNAFVELGADGKENNDTLNFNAWEYYGVDSEGGTRFWDYPNDFSSAEDESEVTVYTYEEVMAFRDTSQEEVTIFTPSVSKSEPREYQVGDIVEITESFYGHDFEIGEHVRLVRKDEYNPDSWKAEFLDGSDYWQIETDEFKLVTPVEDAPVASSNNDTATLEPIEYEGSSSGETVPNRSVGSSVANKQVFSLGDEVEVVESNLWVSTGMKGTIVHIDKCDIDSDKEPYKINFNGKELWVNGYQLKLLNSNVGSTIPEKVCTTAINITTNVSFTVRIKGQEFTLDKDEIRELYLALCCAEGELKEWSLG